jgi:hypothetical protein
MAAQVGPCDEAGRAGRSAQVEYDRRYAEWRTSRRQALLRWVPPALLFAVLGGWYMATATGIRPLGVIFGVLVVGAVADVLYRPPGVLAEWRRAAAGERATGKLLTRSRSDGYAVLHDRRTVRGDIDVEHLVIGPGGMFLLDSKNWATLSEPVRILSGRFWIGREPQTDLLDRLRAEAAGVADEVRGGLDSGPESERTQGSLPVTPVVVVHGARVAGAPRVLSGVAVLEGGQLLRYLSRAERVWAAEQVRRVSAAAERALAVRAE